LIKETAFSYNYVVFKIGVLNQCLRMITQLQASLFSCFAYVKNVNWYFYFICFYSIWDLFCKSYRIKIEAWLRFIILPKILIGCVLCLTIIRFSILIVCFIIFIIIINIIIYYRYCSIHKHFKFIFFPPAYLCCVRCFLCT
jgi:hypothetical protein